MIGYVFLGRETMSLRNCGLKDNDRRRRGLGVVIASVLILAVPAVAAAQDFVQSGTYTGNGAPSLTINELNFQPDLVIVTSAEGRHSNIKTADMSDGSSRNLDDVGGLKEDRILILEANGFTVGTHQDVNESLEEYYWVAMKSVAGTMEIGRYVGDGDFSAKSP